MSHLPDIQPATHTTYLEYPAGAQTCEGYLAWAEREQRPCVLICHAWGGQSEYERAKAEELCRLGYAGFAIDVYGKGRRGHPTVGNEHLMQPMLDDRALLKRRLLAAVEAAQQHPGVDPRRIAVMGYCFGGLCALDLARSGHPDIQGVVSIHGGYSPPNLGPQPPIHASVLILHGDADPISPSEQLPLLADELTQAGADWQIHSYGHAMHAFSFSGAQLPEQGILYHPLAARRAERSLTDFLSEVFQPS